MIKYAIGVDFGTESGRVLIVDLNGNIIARSIVTYKDGVMMDNLPVENSDPLPLGYALQNPNNYLDVLRKGIKNALNDGNISKEEIVGVGITFTSSTVLTVDEQLEPLCTYRKYEKNPHAWVKLWKHHGANDEAEMIHDLAVKRDEAWLADYGNHVSAEWFIPKCLETFHKAPKIYNDAKYFIEAADWIVSKLVGDVVRSNCTLGYKAFWNEEQGFPFDFFDAINSSFGNSMRDKLAGSVKKVGERAGVLSNKMAREIGLLAGTPIATAIIDAHSSLLGIGADEEKQLTMVMGTSTCHLMLNEKQKTVKGISGSVYEAIFPEVYAYEAGQSAVGDLFGSYIKQLPETYLKEAKRRNVSPFQYIEELAAKLLPGENKLLALDWMNGNRSVLANFDLTGLIVGLTLKTKPEEVFRALLEATAFGAKTIIQAYEEAGLPIEKVYACGGLPKKNNLLMQIYADVLNKEIVVSSTDQASGIGAAILGAVAGGGYATVNEAVQQMKQPFEHTYKPVPEHVHIYEKMFQMYKKIYNFFGIEEPSLMSELHYL